MRKRNPNLVITNKAMNQKDQYGMIEEENMISSGEQRSRSQSQRRKQTLKELLTIHRRLNITIACLATLLLLFLWLVTIPQYRICLMITISFTFFLSFIGCGDYFFYETIGQYLYSGILIIHIITGLVCTMIEGLSLWNYQGCLKGRYCRAIQSYSFAWPYSGSLILSLLVVILTMTLGYYYLAIVAELSLLQEERMNISNHTTSTAMASTNASSHTSSLSSMAYTRLPPTATSFEIDSNL